MAIIKSEGVTPTERLLADLCDRSFLKLWSYPNPLRDDRDELCDLLAVFENNVFIFFDRENQTFRNDTRDTQINWNRWKKKVIDDQTRTALGAENYIRSGRGIFLDKSLTVPFPIHIDRQTMVVHKFIIAHGAKEACKEFSNDNVYGSLGISYGCIDAGLSAPFMLHIDKERPVHIFDSHNLPIIFEELDTIFDFLSYLNAKLYAINKFDALVYCGEEDLLANYFMNYDEPNARHFIGTQQGDFNFVGVSEGEWKYFTNLGVYKRKKSADKVSYFSDDIIQRTCENTLNGTLLGNSSPLRGQSAIHEMAKEPRFHRRALSEHIIKAIRQFPESSQRVVRYLSFIPSFYEGKGYVFLQLKVHGVTDYENEYRPKRQAMLEIACGAAKNKFSHLKTIIGIAIDAPKFTTSNSEDFILMHCSDWTEDLKKHYEKENDGLNFFKTNNLRMTMKTNSEFPVAKESQHPKSIKIGRNDPCPCNSGKKYKKCCVDISFK